MLSDETSISHLKLPSFILATMRADFLAVLCASSSDIISGRFGRAPCNKFTELCLTFIEVKLKRKLEAEVSKLKEEVVW